MIVVSEGIPGRVCAKKWSFTEATVVCRQLTGEGAVAAVRVMQPRRTSYPTIWFDGLTCSGTENSSKV